MKKGTKIGLGLAGLLLGVVALSGCTNSFCSVNDKAHILRVTLIMLFLSDDIA